MQSFDRIMRLLAYFMVGLLLGGASVSVFAETLPASIQTSAVQWWSVQVPTMRSTSLEAAQDLCKIWGANYVPSGVTNVPQWNVIYYGCSPGSGGNVSMACPEGSVVTYPGSCKTSAAACPVGQGWTLSGATCSRPDCVLPAVRDAATGACVVPPPICSGAQHLNATNDACICDVTTPATISYTVLASAAKSDPPACNNGCSMSSGGAWGLPVIACSYNMSGITNIATANMTCYARSGQTGAICSAAVGPPIQVTLAPLASTPGATGTNSSGVADPLATAGNNADPLSCGSAGGSFQVISGIGYCNSPTAAAPSTTRQIAVTSSTNPTTGVTTTSTATTTTTCTGAGACSNSTTTNVTVGAVTTSSSTSTGSGPAGGSGGVAAAAAGKAGEALQLPTDYQRDATGIALNVKADKLLQVIGDPVADDSSITGAKATDSAKKELADADKAVVDVIKGGEDGAILSSVSSWEAAMSSGWWVPVPSSSCAPFSAKVGPWNWTLDICPTAAKISDIGGYVMWVLLMFSGFLLLTTPQQYKWM